MLSKINGFQTIKSICEKSKNTENESLLTLCEQTLEVIEKEYSNEKVEDFSECNENSVYNQSTPIEELRILDSMRRFKHRPTYLINTLYRLIKNKLTSYEPRSDLIKLIVVLMKKNSKIIALQSNAIECLIRLTKDKLGEKMEPKIFEKVIGVTLKAMESFPNDRVLQKNSLSLLLSPHLKHDVLFDKNKCMKLILDSLTLEDIDLIRMSIEICLIVSKRLSENEERFYLEKLLEIVLSGVDFSLEYNFIHSTLNAIWLLKDELGEKIGTELLTKVVNVTLTTMELFPNDNKLQPIAIFTLLDDRILQEISFDRLKCIKLLINSLVNFLDRGLNEMTIFICLKLVQKLSIAEKSNLCSNPHYIEILLNIVRNHIDFKLKYENILEYILKTLLTLTYELNENIKTKIFEDIIEVTLLAMELFPNQEQLQKASISILYFGAIIDGILFDKYKCSQLLMKYLVNFKCTDMNRLAVLICSIIARNLSVVEKLNLSSKFMDTLLDIVRRVQYISSDDILLKNTLNCLWNLTDDSPETCQIFQEKRGLDLYFDVLNVSFEQFDKIFYEVFSKIFFFLNEI
jgi:hypothetical protein